jgi:hypothetical protein
MVLLLLSGLLYPRVLFLCCCALDEVAAVGRVGVASPELRLPTGSCIFVVLQRGVEKAYRLCMYTRALVNCQSIRILSRMDTDLPG